MTAALAAGVLGVTVLGHRAQDQPRPKPLRAARRTREDHSRDLPPSVPGVRHDEDGPFGELERVGLAAVVRVVHNGIRGLPDDDQVRTQACASASKSAVSASGLDRARFGSCRSRSATTGRFRSRPARQTP